MKQILLVAAMAAGLVSGPDLHARPQSPANSELARPRFEVASVKTNKSGDGGSRINVEPGGRFTATNTTLRNLIRQSFQLQDFQITGGPDWMGSEHFDIVAKADAEIPPTPPGVIGPMQLMVQSLLEERFKLAVHQEKRDLPIYALVVARSGGRLGAKLQSSTVDCQAIMTAATGRSGSPPEPPPSAPSGRPICGMRTTPGQIMGGGFPLSQLASALSRIVQRTVVDRTGLVGNFDLELAYTPDQMPQGLDPNGPSIFTAVQEQLGLKLDSIRGPVDVLVIDGVTHPAED